MKKLLFLILFAFAVLLPSISFAAIAFDAAVAGPASGSATSINWSHTTTGSDRILFIGFRTGSTATVSDVTYNSVSLTSIGSQVASTQKIWLYYLIAPAEGANTAVITLNATSSIVGMSASYTGALQSGVPDASTVNTGTSSSSITTNLTSIADNAWAVLAVTDNFGTPSAGTGSTVRVAQGAGEGFFDNGAAKTPAGNISMQVTWGGPSDSGAVMATFAPVAAAAVSPKMTFQWINDDD